MSNDALIADLSAGLSPVRRRSAWREVALLALLGGVEASLFLGLGLMRPDMGQMIGSAYMQWKLGSLALVAGMSFTTAIASLVPTASPRKGIMMAVALAAVAMIAGLFVAPVPPGGAMHMTIPQAYGPLCALSIILLSLPMLAGLAVLMRRGAPSHPEGSALAAGLAAGSWGALLFAFCCPANDPLYVIIWYAAGCAVVAAASRWLMPRGFRL